MLFKQALIDQIKAGKKTQTRRTFRPDDDYQRVGDDGVIKAVKRGGRLKWEVGRTYAIQPGRGKKSVGRFRLKEIRLERVDAIIDADAIAEGFNNRQEFFDIWAALYGENWNETAKRCWVLDFEYIGEVN